MYLIAIILGSGYAKRREKGTESHIVILAMDLKQHRGFLFYHNIDWKAQRVLADDISSNLVAYF